MPEHIITHVSYQLIRTNNIFIIVVNRELITSTCMVLTFGFYLGVLTYFGKMLHNGMCSQTKMYSETLNIISYDNLKLSQFICYSFENCNKILQELRVKLCQNKLILKMSDNFDRNVCNEFS